MAVIKRNLAGDTGSFINSAYIGIVKKVDDGKRAGRIKVWIPDLHSAEDQETSWIQCDYCSPFAGATNAKDISQTVTDTDSGSQTAYGFFATVPDLNNEVVVIFIGGDVARAIWIGCLYNEYMMHQVPGIASSRKNKNTDKHVPVTEYNKWDKSSSTALGVNATRPWNEARTTGIGGQGLIKDHVRGLTTSSAMRESPSAVYGMITPGRKKGKSRTGGHSFIMDDGSADGKDSYIGFRTTNGASLRIDDTNGLIYAVNSKGTAWIQMDADGNVDIFGAKSVSVRSQEDINLRADKNINIEAGQNINMKAAKDSDASGKIVGESAGLGGDINMQAMNQLNTTVETDAKLTAKGKYDINIGATITETAGGAIGIKSANLQVTAGGDIANTGKVISAGMHYAPNFKAPGVGLVGHVHSTSPPPSQDGGSSSATGPTAAKTTPIPKNTKTNVLAGFNGTTSITLANSSAAIPNFWDRKTEPMETIVSRLMSYEPCRDHINKGL